MGDAVREARKRASMSQADLAKQLGVSYQAISRWERGKDRIPVERAREISEILDTDLRLFLEAESRLSREEFAESLELPAEVAEWLVHTQITRGATPRRIGIAAVLGYIMQSQSNQDLCMAAATAIDIGKLTMDEAVCCFEVEDPGQFRAGGKLAKLIWGPHPLAPIHYTRGAVVKPAKARAQMEGIMKRWHEHEMDFAKWRADQARARVDAATNAAKI